MSVSGEYWEIEYFTQYSKCSIPFVYYHTSMNISPVSIGAAANIIKCLKGKNISWTLTTVFK